MPKEKVIAIGINGKVTNLTDLANSYSIVNTIYPIGSIYTSIQSDFNPNNSWPGTTWELLKSGIFLEATNDDQQVGNEIQAGLPNITAEFEAGDIDNTRVPGKGAIIKSSVQSGNTYGGSDYMFGKQTLDASRCSSIYGAANTVQPYSIRVKIWKRIS